MTLWGTGTSPTAPAATARVPRMSAPRYEISVTVTDSQIAIAADVSLPPASAQQDSVVFSLAEAMTNVSVEIVEPASARGAANLVPRLRRQERAGWGTVAWTVRPLRPIPAGQALTLRVQAVSKPRQAAEIFAVDKGAAFAAGIKTAWYPEIEDGPEYPNGEPHGLRGTGRLRFRLPSGSTVFAPGSVESNAGASETVVRFDAPIYFTFAAGHYAVAMRRGQVPVSMYQFRARPYARGYAAGAAQVLALLVKEFGAFPQARFAIVEVPTDQADRAGFAGASLEGLMFATTEFLDRPFNLAYFGHEISHQWWPNSVRGNRGPPKNWIMSEALAQYGSLRVVEEVEGPTAAASYRRRGYPGFPEATSAEAYLRLAASGTDDKLGDLTAKPSVARALVLTKGALVWEMLSREAGRENFRAAMRAFTSSHAGMSVPWDEFLHALSLGARRNMQPLYEEWFYRTGAPDLALSWKWERSAIRLRLIQSEQRYALTVPVVIVAGNRRTEHHIAVQGHETVVTLPAVTQPDSVLLDPLWQVLRWTPETRKEAEALTPYTRAQRMLDDGDAQGAERVVRDGLAAVSSEDPHCVAFMLRTLTVALLMSHERWKEARDEVRGMLAMQNRRLDAVAGVYLKDAEAARRLGDTLGMHASLDSAIAADRRTGGLTGASDEAQALLRRK